jgi:ubiquinone/menaquinone biosynthesis C-methylase UbiE
VINIKEDRANINQYLQLGLLQPKEYRDAVQYIFEVTNRPLPSFVAEDVTNTTSLKDNHFDLVYCERFLYHFACSTEDKSSEEIKIVIQEMRRLIKPGGIIVAIEPNFCSPNDQRLVDLANVFNQAGLDKFDTSQISPSIDNRTFYTYTKRE